MAAPMTADQTLAAMRKWKVPYKEYSGWRTRGRPASTGPFSDVRGIMIHHTGSDAGQSDAYLQFLFVDGRSDLPAPLCHVATDMDGDLWLGATGRANHAGSGSSTVLEKVTAESHPGYTSELRPGADAVDGNARFYGNEVRYDGGQPMTALQYAAATRWAAAVCDHHGWSALSIIGHREWTTRKPDPGNCPMNKFRSDVAALLKAGPPGTVKPPAAKPPVATPPKDSPMTEAQAADALAAHIHAKAAAAEAEATMTRLGLPIPACPAVTGSGDPFAAHYWAKRTAALLLLIDAKLAGLGYPKKV
jgi:hypothetical protein